MTTEFQKNAALRTPITLCDTPVSAVRSLCFLASYIQDLQSGLNISSLIKKAQQRMYFLQQLKKLNLLISESILTSSNTTWYTTAKDKGQLHGIVHSAEKVIAAIRCYSRTCTPGP